MYYRMGVKLLPYIECFLRRNVHNTTYLHVKRKQICPCSSRRRNLRVVSLFKFTAMTTHLNTVLAVFRVGRVFFSPVPFLFFINKMKMKFKNISLFSLKARDARAQIVTLRDKQHQLLLFMYYNLRGTSIIMWLQTASFPNYRNFQRYLTFPTRCLSDDCCLSGDNKMRIAILFSVYEIYFLTLSRCPIYIYICITWVGKSGYLGGKVSPLAVNKCIGFCRSLSCLRTHTKSYRFTAQDCRKICTLRFFLAFTDVENVIIWVVEWL